MLFLLRNRRAGFLGGGLSGENAVQALFAELSYIPYPTRMRGNLGLVRAGAIVLSASLGYDRVELLRRLSNFNLQATMNPRDASMNERYGTEKALWSTFD
jgi:hypothetical protein